MSILIYGLSIISLYLFVPILLRIMPSFINHCIFQHLLCPPNCISKLNHPKSWWKLEDAEHHTIQLQMNETIGVWHINPTITNTSAKTAKKVILYCHGSAYHRAHPIRLGLYRFLSGNGFHVVTFDYRGFADSRKNDVPTERSAIDDILTVIQWMYQQNIVEADSQFLLWGHSMGTALSTQALCNLQDSHPHLAPDGLVLEAPFNTLLDEIKCYPLSKYFMKLYPGDLLMSLLKRAFHIQHFKLNTDDYLLNVKCPVLILHAEDDTRVDVALAKKLFNTSLNDANCPNKSIKCVLFKKNHGLGHRCIYKHYVLKSILVDFLNKKYAQEKVMTLI